jgi:hypothetical protein
MKAATWFLTALVLANFPAYGQEDAARRPKNPGEPSERTETEALGFMLRPTPLSGWGGIGFPGSEQREDKDNAVLEGAFEQGLDLYAPGAQGVVTAFVSLNYARDSEKFDYNNKAKPAIGLKLRYFPTDGLAFAAGAKYEIERRTESGEEQAGYTAFVDWYAGWSLPELPGYSLAFPGFTWGGIRYPGAHSAEEEEALVLEGSAEQGVDWRSFYGATLNSFVEFGYVADTKGVEWNNNVTYGVGSKIKIPAGAVTLHIGGQFNRNIRLHNGKTADKALAFLRWMF